MSKVVFTVASLVFLAYTSSATTMSMNVCMFSETVQAPGAGSFNNPKRTGWLFKHGGSGISSHWKKRWFVADDHHLFYYKSPSVIELSTVHTYILALLCLIG